MEIINLRDYWIKSGVGNNGIKKGEKEISPLCNGHMEIYVVGYMKQYTVNLA